MTQGLVTHNDSEYVTYCSSDAYCSCYSIVCVTYCSCDSIVLVTHCSCNIHCSSDIDELGCLYTWENNPKQPSPGLRFRGGVK
jgi:hypothetical protein